MRWTGQAPGEGWQRQTPVPVAWAPGVGFPPLADSLSQHPSKRGGEVTSGVATALQSAHRRYSHAAVPT